MLKLTIKKSAVNNLHAIGMPCAISYYNQNAGKPYSLFRDDLKQQMLFHVFLCEELALVSPVPCYFAEVVLVLAILEVVVVVFSVAVLNAVMTHRLSILSLVLCSNTMSRRVASFPMDVVCLQYE